MMTSSNATLLFLPHLFSLLLRVLLTCSESSSLRNANTLSLHIDQMAARRELDCKKDSLFFFHTTTTKDVNKRNKKQNKKQQKKKEKEEIFQQLVILFSFLLLLLLLLLSHVLLFCFSQVDWIILLFLSRWKKK
jgi:cation transport ATPase